jgi:hypothetical protein
MPSFCKPFGFGPNAAMTRPRTGQRKLGMSLAASAVFTGLSAAVGALVASRALCGESSVAMLVPVISGTGASARGAADTGCAATSGMVMRSPTLTLVSAEILLALAMTRTGLR